MKLYSLFVLSISIVIFNARGMEDGGSVFKEKKTENINDIKYTYKVFKQARTKYYPASLIVTRKKNKKTGSVSFSGNEKHFSTENIFAHELAAQEIISFLSLTTHIFSTKAQSKWNKLKKVYKSQKLNDQTN